MLAQDIVTSQYPDIVLIARHSIEIALIDTIPEYVGLLFVDVTVCCKSTPPMWDDVKTEVLGQPHPSRHFTYHRLVSDSPFGSEQQVSDFLLESGKRLTAALNQQH